MCVCVSVLMLVGVCVCAPAPARCRAQITHSKVLLNFAQALLRTLTHTAHAVCTRNINAHINFVLTFCHPCALYRSPNRRQLFLIPPVSGRGTHPYTSVRPSMRGSEAPKPPAFATHCAARWSLGLTLTLTLTVFGLVRSIWIFFHKWIFPHSVYLDRTVPMKRPEALKEVYQTTRRFLNNISHTEEELSQLLLWICLFL